MKYEKPPLTVTEQASRLQDRGLRCDDPKKFEHYLAHIGYYRLSAYCLPFEVPTATPTRERTHRFLDGTTFEQVLGLYIFDRKLRLLVMEAVERIEVSVRTRWAGAMALRHGSHAHMKPELFKCPWTHARDLAKAARELQESNETFVVHYRRKYHEPFLPPIWAVVETMSLGNLSRWFANTKDNEIKKEVMRGLDLPTIEVLESVLHVLTPIRNVCAHHARLWNRSFPMVFPHIKRMREKLIPPNSPGKQAHLMFNVLVVLDALMAAINPRSAWGRRLMSLLETRNDQERSAMGFPADWRNRSPWTDL